MALPQTVVVNSTGLGAMKLWNDAKMVPIKGQLAMLPAQPNLAYLYGQNGYMFPRSDHIVIGGTFEVGVNNEVPNKATCRDLSITSSRCSARLSPRPWPTFTSIIQPTPRW